MYGNDLSSRRRTLNGGRWRFTRFCSRWSASTLGARDDHLNVRDAARQERDLRAAVLALLEVRADARAERLRLAHVEDVAFRIPEEVDPGLRGQRRQLSLHTFFHRPGYRSQVDEGHDPAPLRRSCGRVRPRAGGPRGRSGARAGRDRGRRPRAHARRGRRARWICWSSPASAACASPRSGRPASVQSSANDRTILENVAAAAKLDHVTVLTSITNQGSRTTPLSDNDQADFASLCGFGRQSRARPEDRHHRQRAEPQSVLAAAVRRRRHGHGGARLREPPRPRIRRREGRRE